MRRILIAAALLVFAAWITLGAVVRVRRAPRVAPARGEVRGAFHVHTTHSDGRGSLTKVVEAARAAGLQFVVVTDHNVLTPGEQGWHEGVLVIEGTEASTEFGHVVALGVPRALTADERERDPLGAIANLGGEAIVAHPFHPRRPFTGWGRGPWRGLEIVSNDTSWAEVVAGEWGRAALAAAMLPFDAGSAVVALQGDSHEELRRFDDELHRARSTDRRRLPHVLLCSADAHGYPSYQAAFEAFSMHLPVTFSGDASADERAAVAALTDGRAVCVLDAVAPIAQVRFVSARGGMGLDLILDAPDLRAASFTLLRDGVPIARQAPAVAGGPTVLPFECEGGRCPPGDYRVEGRWGGRPWIFTNPVRIE